MMFCWLGSGERGLLVMEKGRGGCCGWCIEADEVGGVDSGREAIFYHFRRNTI